MTTADLLLFGAIVCAFVLGWIARGRAGPGESQLPAATKRQLERARKASRAHLDLTRLDTPVGLHTFDDTKETL